MWTWSLNKTWSLIFSTFFFNKYAATSQNIIYNIQLIVLDSVIESSIGSALTMQYYITESKTINYILFMLFC